MIIRSTQPTGWIMELTTACTLQGLAGWWGIRKEQKKVIFSTQTPPSFVLLILCLVGNSTTLHKVIGTKTPHLHSGVSLIIFKLIVLKKQIWQFSHEIKCFLTCFTCLYSTKNSYYLLSIIYFQVSAYLAVSPVQLSSRAQAQGPQVGSSGEGVRLLILTFQWWFRTWNISLFIFCPKHIFNHKKCIIWNYLVGECMTEKLKVQKTFGGK